MNDYDNSKPAGDITKAQELASRYRCDFIDLRNVKLDVDLFRRVPPALMFRHSFVPVEEMPDGRLAVAVADPSQLMLLDEISLLLGKRLVIRVTPLAQINEILRGIDPHSTEKTGRSPDDPMGPGDPDAGVRAPKKPRPHLRSSAEKAVPEEQQ